MPFGLPKLPGPLWVNVVCSNATTPYGTPMPQSGRRPQHQKRRFDPLSTVSGLPLPAQPVEATQALNLSAGVSNCKVSRGRSFSWRATLFR